MERKFQCPSCGAGNTVTNPGVLMKVCDFCKTAIYWDKESALRAGQKSMDLPASPRFKLGGTGRIKGKSFRVLGRLTYSHEKGTWNEWFVEMQDGKILWLAEDEGEIFLEERLELTTPVPKYEELKPGAQISLNDRVGVIEELGEARCIGGEGQIPFEIEIGEVYPYADGTGVDGSFIFGLEYDTESGVPTAFIGKALTLKETKAAVGERREAVERTAEVIRCPSCGKPYEGRRLESTKSVACQSCGSVLSLDEAEAKVVGQNKGKQPAFTFAIGTPIKLEGTQYEVMGRLYYVEREEGSEYPSQEYVLYNPDKGYLWLSQEQGHFTISSPLHMRVSFPSLAVPKQKVKVGEDEFQVFEQGTVRLEWVDGALPWTAAVAEQTNYTTIIKPPEYVDKEITGKEVELFRGRYVGREEMTAAAPEGTKLPDSRGVYSCQPYTASDWIKGLGQIGATFLFLNIMLLIYSFVADQPKIVLKHTVSGEAYTKEAMTTPFEIAQPGTICRLTGSAPLKNSWLALDFALVNSDELVLKEFYKDASFYEGRDSEGYWSEGSKHFKTYFRVEKPGTYRLLVHGQGGSGYGGPRRKEPVDLMVVTNSTISYYFIFPIILSAIFASWELVAQWIFERRRWAAFEQSGDSDGDDD